MKKQVRKVAEVPTMLKPGVARNEVGKSGNRSRGRGSRLAGKSEKLLVVNGKHSVPSSSSESLGSRPLNEDECAAKTTTRCPIPQQLPEQALHLSGKIKLQLFPLDEVTRIGLEKDGFHPYLELTLSPRKKISSVLKHLNNKWGASRIVTEEAILLPFDISEKLGQHRWTLNDIGLSAGDVYAALGRPPTFRLRYGWLSEYRNESAKVPSTSTPCEASLQFEGMQNACGGNVQSIHAEGKQIEETVEDLKRNIVDGTTDAKMPDKMRFGGLIESEHNDGKSLSGSMQHDDGRNCTGIGQSLWDDSLTNISIGGLLSEASLQGRINSGDPKLVGGNGCLQTSQLISDSFDAFIMSQFSHSQTPRLPSSSILDAEDTCHAFAFQKFSSSNKDGSYYSHTSRHDDISKAFKNSTSEFNVQSDLPQGNSNEESETGLSLRSSFYNDESSLGLSGIKWTDSLGPFDLGLSSKKIMSSDSLSISKIIS